MKKDKKKVKVDRAPGFAEVYEEALQEMQKLLFRLNAIAEKNGAIDQPELYRFSYGVIAAACISLLREGQGAKDFNDTIQWLLRESQKITFTGLAPAAEEPSEEPARATASESVPEPAPEVSKLILPSKLH